MADSFSIYENLPDEPELAFLYLDDIFQQVLEDSIKGWDDPPNHFFVEYMSKVLATRTELKLDVLSDWTRPAISDFTYDTYLNFRHDVVHYRTAIQIRFGKRTNAYSVRLDTKAKAQIHHLIGQIRQLILEDELSDRKRETLLDKLAAFENEVDRDRTRFEAFGAAVVELGGYFGEAAKRADLHRLIDGIAKIIHGSKEEETKQLPRPTDRKQIEPPKKAPPSKKLLAELDDEIPF